MEFCPYCGNFLQYETSDVDRDAGFFCRACPYIYTLEKGVKVKRKARLIKTEVEPLVVAEKSVGPTIEAVCPKCRHGQASFEQRQIRSADEPMTIIYTCLNEACGNRWREE